jgi:DNA-binding response OmpR family regulator
MKKILIIEDDLAFLKGIKAILEQEHYRALTETDGERGLKRALSEKVDLILLDLMLPSRNGEEICREIRSHGIKTPVVVLTAKDDEIDEITLLKMGADEYLKKTISPALLKARIENVFNIQERKTPILEKVSFGDITIDFKKLEATKGSVRISLMTREFDILKFLIEHSGEVVSRDDLLNNVWEEDAFPTPRTVDNYILSIRKKIEDDREHPKYILTIPRAGYKFSEES